MIGRKNTFAAILWGSLGAATLLVVLAWSPGTILALINGRSQTLAFTLSIALTAFAWLWGLSGLGAITFGMLWHTFALRRRWTSVFAYAFVGVLVGAILPAVITAPVWIGEIAHPPTEPIGSAFAMIATIGGAAQGMLTALFAWLIRRPDRDPPNPPTSTP